MGLFDFFSKEKKETLDKGLEKTNTGIFDKISKAILGKSKVDEGVLDELEEILISSDVGVNTTLKIIKRIERRVADDKYSSTSELDKILREEVAALLEENNSQDVQNSFETENLPKPYVLMVVGVNGVGKTTTIGKLAYNFQKNGKKVVLGAADTFMAAAVDQLKLWGERVGVTVVDHGMNTDPSSVAYDAVKIGTEQGADVIIIDTAGRLHTKVNLMNELGKIKRVMQKINPDAPHEVMLVLDGSTGQNALIQAQEFTRVTDVSSLAITKLDGTAKGGVVIGISDQFKIPVKYIGVGEKMEDLQVFNKTAFVEGIFKKN
jgi:fused signal recognition particle receptor